MNNVVLKGRLTKDVDLRYTQGSEPKAYCMFSVAVNRMKEGECDFINCKAWGKTAEFLGKYFKKGQEVVLQGRIEVSTQNTDGINKTFTNVVAERVEFCGSKADNAGSSNDNQSAAGFTPTNFDEDDDLPF